MYDTPPSALSLAPADTPANPAAHPAAHSAAHPADDSAPAVRHVQVSVSAAGQLSCKPSVLDVSGANVLISFELLTAGWVFPASQAVVVTAGGKQFPLPSWTLHPQQAALLDLDSQAGDFAYTVQVQHTGTGQKLSLDPTIRNQL